MGRGGGKIDLGAAFGAADKDSGGS
ncbi:hypothetical protein CCACVL1_04274 [Corchorus capsularis]|uniref:Uncharacterized protein n=1 Tax=Corchorus capsularis TaxID=210143 RepID=A0A1R3JTR2_COCAP|nr:hypothetical protein CCACVL1_29492 [Corchorus capsularis]OMO98263.1 hypothetical protein CCACVL1_04274 [Corchorus capsularis]